MNQHVAKTVDPLPLDPDAISNDPYLRAPTFPDLLGWDDVDFVRCAYVTLLGRQPEPAGERFYTALIRTGGSKLLVLNALRRSAEGRAHDPGISGLDRILRRARWEQGWAGWLVRLVTRGEGDGPVWRRHRSLLNAIARGDLDRQRHSAGALASIDAKLDRLTQVLRSAPRKGSSALRHAGLSDPATSGPEFDDRLTSSARNIARVLYAALSRA